MDSEIKIPELSIELMKSYASFKRFPESDFDVSPPL